MIVTEVEIVPCAVPRREPIKTVFGTLAAHDHVVVAVRLDSGECGYGEASPLPWNGGETVASVTAILGQHFGPLPLGHDVRRPAQLQDALDRTTFTANPSARAALELALLDARGRALRVPSRHLLGGFADSVRATAILGSGSPSVVAEEAATYQATVGVTSFKIKVGLGLRADVELVRTVREAVGPRAVIYADANQAYTAQEALAFLQSLGDARLDWFEEPCPVAAASARRTLVASSPVPVLADETCGDVDTAVTSVLGGLSTMLSVKPARTGVSRSLQLAEFCRSTGTPAIIGSTGETALGVYGSAAVAASSGWTAARPAELLMHRDLAVDLAPRPVVADGVLHLPDSNGLGPDVDRAALDAVTTAAPTVLQH